jgi:HEAT repeat protein
VAGWRSFSFLFGRKDGGGVRPKTEKFANSREVNSGYVDKAKGDSASGYVFHRQGKKNQFFKEMADYAMHYGKAGIPQLLEFLKDPDWEVRCAALRALGLIEGEKSKKILMGYIQDGVSVEEAAQAALALGGMEDPDVTRLLVKKIGEIKREDVQRALMDALAGRPYEQTASFFQTYLNSPTVSGAQKGSALAGLGFHQDAPAQLLVSYVSNPDEEVRAGAYDGLAARREAQYGQMLLGRLSAEQDPGLREKVYEAAGAQQDTLPSQLASASRKEPDPAARLRAERAWGMTVGRTDNQEDRRRFDVEAVPRLVVEALQNPDPGEQRAALQALAMARTAGSRSGLEKIAQETTSPQLSKLATAMAKGGKKKDSGATP